MPLPAPQSRRQVSTREILFRCFRRDDGLWDVEGELIDTKDEPYEVRNERSWQPGEPIHHMLLRVTIDDAKVVREISVAMQAYPLGICPQSMANMQRMVGCTMARGWRKAIEHHLGKDKGCTHLRELLFSMATAAFQGMERYRVETAPDEVPAYLGTCATWSLSSPVVEREFPLLYRPPVSQSVTAD